MAEAVEEAGKSLALDEFPVGAVLVLDGKLPGTSIGRCRSDNENTRKSPQLLFRSLAEEGALVQSPAGVHQT